MSIGDVLSLLRQEFPDVTISKIRFLESQGLVEPERTPSGYRKFYDHDVERLRWVLRQQREHFLPLKVIRGRLDQDADGLIGGGDSVEAGRFEDLDHPDGLGIGGYSGEGLATPALVGGAEVMADVSVDSSRASGGQSSQQLPGFDVERSRGERPSGTPRARVGEERPLAARVTMGVQPPRHAQPTGQVQPPSEPQPTGQVQPTGAPQATGRSAVGGMAVAGVSGVSMTTEELMGACGIDYSEVEQLVSFGLLSGRVVGGVMCYDEDALTVARLAAGFARYGVEPRHLRIYKHSAEREAGFIEQVVLPLLKQRNPEARQRAYAAVEDLSHLGQELRGALLRAAMRQQIGG